MQQQLDAIERLLAQARHQNHRYPVVLAGSRDSCRRLAAAVINRHPGRRTLWVGTGGDAGETVDNPRVSRVLGGEYELAVYDAWSGFDPDAFGAVSGTVRGGGLLLLLTPTLDRWPVFDDPEKARIATYPRQPASIPGRFLSRLARVIASDAGVLRLEPGQPVPELPAPQPIGTIDRPPDAPWRTEDQRLAVAAVERVGTGRRGCPAVLTADRGRGKSAALGIAAARLLASGPRRIVVTAPRPAATATLFRHAGALLPHAEQARPGLISVDDGRIEFVAPDTLAFDAPPADLVLVDEAAAIPTPLLQRMLSRYRRIAFATTVHGYEGTGRGFALQFRRVLDARTPGWREVTLDEPIRWAAGDPLERFTFRALLLDATATMPSRVPAPNPADLDVERVDRDRLAAGDDRLQRIFGLLVMAHYQTRPSDLRNLLDGPGLGVWCLRHGETVVAAALAAREGGFDAALARAVWLGRRRPRGHLIPQSLATHAGLETATRLEGMRVLRIAVHPSLQGRGLGTRLLAALVADARTGGLDFIGASFGATPELIRFWHHAELLPVRIGTHRDTASGTHSAIVLHPLSKAGNTLHQTARARFVRHLACQLGDPLRDLDPRLAVSLLRRADGDPPPPSLDDADWRDLITFAFGRRRYADCRGALWHLTLLACSHPSSAPVDDAALAALVQRVLQARDWATVARGLGVNGRGAAETCLRETTATLLRRLADPQLLAAAGFPGARGDT